MSKQLVLESIGAKDSKSLRNVRIEIPVGSIGNKGGLGLKFGGITVQSNRLDWIPNKEEIEENDGEVKKYVINDPVGSIGLEGSCDNRETL